MDSPKADPSPASLRTRLTEIDAAFATHPANFDQRAKRSSSPNVIRPTSSWPPLLASVCRAWRRIALNLGQIWSGIQMGWQSAGTDMLFQCCLARAGQHPLFLDMRISDPEPYTHSLFAAAARYSKQWQEVVCTIDLPLAFSVGAIRGRLPLLRKLVLKGIGSDLHTLAHVTAFSDVPKLREVVIAGIPAPSATLLPWAQLVSLTCSMYDTAEVLEMLRQTPRLEKLEARRLLDATPRSPEPVLLNHLHTLKIRSPISDYYLPGLTLPALRVLDIYQNSNCSADPALLAFLLRSTWQLRSLSVTNISLPFATRVLAATPTVEEVQIGGKKDRDWSRDWAPDEELFPFLRRLSTDAAFLPNLQTLRMSFYLSRFPPQLVEMLEARWYQRCDAWKQLNRCKIWVPEAPRHKAAAAPDVLDRLRVLKAEGLDLEVPNIRLELIAPRATTSPAAWRAPARDAAGPTPASSGSSSTARGALLLCRRARRGVVRRGDGGPGGAGRAGCGAKEEYV
ncbi:hypothetical protein C8R47DRAFT_1236434 [Mycena vitilis]|nr:hypothetical protein C8R47DRAFT_1236434 [Mycena vitilis]